jgi:lysophospholipase L1-like esterase
MAKGFKSHRIVANCLSWGLLPVVLLVVIEVLVRNAGVAPPAAGNTMRPDLDLLWISDRGDPRELRFQDLPAGALTAVSVGDSSVYGEGVQASENFTSILESRSNGRLKTLNLAAPGYSSVQSLIALETLLPREHPDLLIIATLWSDNNFDSFVDKDLLAQRQAFSFRTMYLANRFLSQLALWRWLLDQTGNLTSTRVGWGRQEVPEEARPRRVAINDYAQNLWRMVDLAEASGAEVLFVLLANEEDIFQTMRCPAYEPYRDVLRDVANRRGYPVVEVPHLFRQSGLPARTLFLDQMHPSTTGHQLIAKGIANTLQERNWFSGKTLKKPTAASALPTYTDPFAELDSENPRQDGPQPPLPGPGGC